ncbi:MAG: hypothetical protein JJU36_06470 [Phycisphaeraceae bacterium]|nr:hypothetical protein [Phycisphaeraceae bacterium]
MPTVTPLAATHSLPGHFKSLPLLRKDCARVGRFILPERHGHGPTVLDISPARMDRWIHTFASMRRSGIRIDLTIDHEPGAAGRIGEIIELYRCGDKSFEPDPTGMHLAFVCRPADMQALPIILRNPEASLELEQPHRDGLGQLHQEAITAISLVRQPVIPGQRPFEILNRVLDAGRSIDARQVVRASRIGKEPPTARYTASSAIPQVNPKRSNLSRSLNMNPQETLTRIAELIELNTEDTQTEPDDLLIRRIDQIARQAQRAGTLEDELADMRTQRDELAGRIDALEDEHARPEPDIDDDALEDMAESQRSRLDRLVDEGRINPAAAVKLAASLFGQPGSRPAICLSRRAATFAGLDMPLARAVLDALALNTPLITDQRTGPQLLALHRARIDGDERTPAADGQLKAWVQEVNHPGRTLPAL